MTKTSPLTLHAGPAAGFDEPFEMLVACHQRVERMLALLDRLAAHLARVGADADARAAAADVTRYFDVAGPAHHEDEARHVFPVLRARGDARAGELADRLEREHVDMERLWEGVRCDLARVAAGEPPASLDDATARWRAFAALYRGHLRAEEDHAFPAARAATDADARVAMGREMAGRRGAA